MEYSFSPTREEDSVLLGAERFPESFASGGPISFSSERNGGKNAAKNPWFLDFLCADFDAAEKGSAGIGHGPAPAAADVAGREHWQFYRFKRLSNRALAAAGRKCRCGPLGREIRQASAPPRGAWERQRYEDSKRFVVRRSAYILVFAGYAAAFYDAVSRAGSLETCGFKQRFWSLLGLRPKVTRARGAEYSCQRHERNEQRAVGDAGPYGVRLSGCAGIRETADMDATVPLHDNRPARLRAVRGSGSDKRSTRDSLYGDLWQVGFRGVRGGVS